jgi:hypothetical protein
VKARNKPASEVLWRAFLLILQDAQHACDEWVAHDIDVGQSYDGDIIEAVKRICNLAKAR